MQIHDKEREPEIPPDSTPSGSPLIPAEYIGAILGSEPRKVPAFGDVGKAPSVEEIASATGELSAKGRALETLKRLGFRTSFGIVSRNSWEPVEEALAELELRREMVKRADKRNDDLQKRAESRQAEIIVCAVDRGFSITFPENLPVAELKETLENMLAERLVRFEPEVVEILKARPVEEVIEAQQVLTFQRMTEPRFRMVGMAPITPEKAAEFRRSILRSMMNEQKTEGGETNV